MRQLRDGMFVELKRSVSSTLDMHKWLSRTTVEHISQGGLGTSFDVLSAKNVNHPYGAAMKAYM